MNATYIFLQIHHGLSVNMNLALMGPWNNNSVIVESDNLEVYRFTYTYNESEATSCYKSSSSSSFSSSSSSSSSLSSSSSSSAYLTTVTFGINHSAWGLMLNFSSDIYSSDSDLSWGVCSLDIVPTFSPVDHLGNELYAASVLTLSCSQPAEDIGWIYTPSYNTVTCSHDHNHHNTHYVGDFGMSGSVKGSLRVANAHHGLVINFKLALFDTWEDDSVIYVIADNDVVYVIKPADYYSSSSSSSQTVLRTCNDSLNYTNVNVTFGFNHTLNTLNLEIASTLGERSLDQSWGLCDLSIVPTAEHVTVDGDVIPLML